MKRQAGFTIIELVMVIVILGILSAFALPRFADLGGDARTASLNGLAGALKSAASIAHAEQLVSGLGVNASVTLEGQTVTMVNGYPTADAAGIAAAAGVSATDYPTTTPTATSVVFTLNSSATCTVTYNAASSSTSPYTVAVVSSGC